MAGRAPEEEQGRCKGPAGGWRPWWMWSGCAAAALRPGHGPRTGAGRGPSLLGLHREKLSMTSQLQAAGMEKGWETREPEPGPQGPLRHSPQGGDDSGQRSEKSCSQESCRSDTSERMLLSVLLLFSLLLLANLTSQDKSHPKRSRAKDSWGSLSTQYPARGPPTLLLSSWMRAKPLRVLRI